MLSLDKCRELIGDSALTDEQLMKVRSELYALARLVISSFSERPAPGKIREASVPQKIDMDPTDSAGHGRRGS